MSKKVLVITSSYRSNSNSEILADSFIKGAMEAGNNVEKISLKDKKIEFCKGCLACQNLGKCVIEDDSNLIVEMMLNAEVIVFATPIYYYSISGQLKTMLDRANPLYSLDYKFREIYLLTSAAEDEDYTVVGAKTAIQGWIDCFEKAEFKGIVFAGGVDTPGAAANHKAVKEAYEMGKAV